MATSGPTDEGMSELREDFEQLDEDRDGRIEFREFLDWWTSP